MLRWLIILVVIASMLFAIGEAMQSESGQLRLEIIDAAGRSYYPAFRNLRFSKDIFGGEDVSLSYVLDRDPRIDYPDVGYGHEVILRKGLTAIWTGEIRQIDSDIETLTIGCLGRWVYLEDFNCGGEQRLCCDLRLGKWILATNDIPLVTITNWTPEKYEMDMNYRLYIAPRRGEIFRVGVNGSNGGVVYIIDTDEINRVSFDYDIDLAWTTNFELRLYSITRGAISWLEWVPGGGTISTGVKDITISNPGGAASYLVFYMSPAGLCRYTGETGEDVFAIITNLRVWGQVETESPSVIHVAESMVDQLEADTPISADKMLVQEQLFVRDSFVDTPGVLLANHQPDVDKERDGWTLVEGTYDIQADEANVSVLSGANRAFAVSDAGVSDGIVTSDCEAVNSGFNVTELIFRYQDANNYWGLYIEPANGRIQLGVRIAAGWNTIWDDVTIGTEYAFLYNLMVRLRGDRIDCYLGGVWRYGTNDIRLQNATWYGIRDAGVDSIGNRHDNFEVFQALPLWPLFYERGESCYDAMKDAGSFGDWNRKMLGWGVESGGDRVYVKQADRSRVRYVVPPENAIKLSVRGRARKEMTTEAWAKYIDEEGIDRWTEKYYAHVTPAGIVANTTSTGNDLASTLYGITRDEVVDFGRVDVNLAIEYLQQWLIEHAHPAVASKFEVYGPVQDMFRGGMWIDPSEMEMGYLVRIPRFRAMEAEGVAVSDLRDWETTFLMVAMEYDAERGKAKLIPEGPSETLGRVIGFAKRFGEQEEKRVVEKRERVLGM